MSEGLRDTKVVRREGLGETKMVRCETGDVRREKGKYLSMGVGSGGI